MRCRAYRKQLRTRRQHWFRGTLRRRAACHEQIDARVNGAVTWTYDSNRRVDLIGVKLAVLPEVRVLNRERQIFKLDAAGSRKGGFEGKRFEKFGGRRSFDLRRIALAGSPRRHDERVDYVCDASHGDDCRGDLLS